MPKSGHQMFKLFLDGPLGSYIASEPFCEWYILLLIIAAGCMNRSGFLHSGITETLRSVLGSGGDMGEKTISTPSQGKPQVGESWAFGWDDTCGGRQRDGMGASCFWSV